MQHLKTIRKQAMNMRSLARHRFVVVTFWLCVLTAVSCVLFAFSGKHGVDRLYSRGGCEFLNTLTGEPGQSSQQAYFEAISSLFYRFHFVLITGYLAIYGFCFLAHRFFFSSKPIPLTIAIGWAAALVVLLYLYNPFWRVLGYHSLLRARVSYQIMNGHIPPPEPLLAGAMSQEPWGHPWLGAMLSQTLGISLFHAYAIINVLCIIGFMLITYWIARRIFNNRKTGVFAAVIATFATTPACRFIINRVNPHLGFYKIEHRAVPIFGKFFSVNGVPLGILFYSLFILSLIDVFIARRKRGYALLAVSIVGCGFFYPAFFPSFLGVLLVLTAMKILALRWTDIHSFIPAKPLILFWLIFPACTALLVPYFQTIGDTLDCISLLGPKQMVANSVNLLIALGPLACLMAVYFKGALAASNRGALGLLLCVLAASAGMYVGVHLPCNNEYKFLLIAGVALGIAAAGGAWQCLAARRPWPACFLFVLFTVPAASNYLTAAGVMQTYGPFSTPLEKREFVETETNLASADPEENELYEWIVDNTPPDAIFVDSTLDLPVYCNRTLYVGLDPDEHTTHTGYSMTIKVISYLYGYDLDTVNERMETVRHIYGLPANTDRAAVLDVLQREGLYIIYRKNPLFGSAFETDGLSPVFTTSNHNFSIYRADN